MPKAESISRRDCEATTHRLEKQIDNMDHKLDKLNDSQLILQTQFNDLKIHFNDNLKGTVSMQIRSQNRNWDIMKIALTASISFFVSIGLYLLLH